uniref:Uncharacterized protein n=1 Tax=Candidatus Kentrum sp. TUN TaxID=2126343 RepID=A0A450ZQW9_9GAMM|nr:MAG: hypothetical protein BECKTUN1418F_GA0071002_10812 [Candidatus Kentron sp. TUN]VFK62324.1 MAG: hypothetical protein BECKTUN1418E_GA0071001_10782 [Candidatus Kentron sp. TUN]
MNPSTRFKALIDRKLREHWSPEQALAIYDLLSELGEIIWRNPSPQKIVIAPARWFKSDKLDDRDLIPSSWLRI